MTLDEAIIRYKTNAEYERTHGNLQGCLEFRQLAKWLEQLQKIEKIIKDHDYDRMPEDYWYIDRVREVLKHENDD